MKVTDKKLEILLNRARCPACGGKVVYNERGSIDCAKKCGVILGFDVLSAVEIYQLLRQYEKAERFSEKRKEDSI